MSQPVGQSCRLADTNRGFGRDAAPRRYQIVDGKVDEGTYQGYRRYHASCNHCHGPDGIGSTFAPSLIDRLVDVATFRKVMLEGVTRGASVMKGYAGDSNVEPFLDDIYAYLQARADGRLGRARPQVLAPRANSSPP